jgi:hypothetical protein
MKTNPPATPVKPPRPPAAGCVKIAIEGSEEILLDFVSRMNQIYGFRYEWLLLDSNVHKGMKFQRIEVQVRE